MKNSCGERTASCVGHPVDRVLEDALMEVAAARVDRTGIHERDRNSRDLSADNGRPAAEHGGL